MQLVQCTGRIFNRHLEIGCVERTWLWLCSSDVMGLDTLLDSILLVKIKRFQNMISMILVENLRIIPKKNIVYLDGNLWTRTSILWFVIRIFYHHLKYYNILLCLFSFSYIDRWFLFAFSGPIKEMFIDNNILIICRSS